MIILYVIKIMSKYSGLIFDIDGVFHNHGTIVNNEIPKVIDKLKNKPVLLITNEDRFLIDEIKQNLEKCGLLIPKSWGIYSSINSTIDYLVTKKIKDILVIGTDNLQDEIYNNIHCNEDGENFIIIGMINKRISKKLYDAVLIKIINGARVILTNGDVYIPCQKLYLSKPNMIYKMPLQILKEIEIRIHRIIPYTVTGKPSLTMQRKIITYFNNLNNLILIGDTLESDIQIANNLGITSCLVLSGNTTLEKAQNSNIKPTIIHDNILFLL